MQHDTYHFWGMHFVWWFVLGIILLWIFVSPYNIPGQRSKKETPIEILKKRFAIGQITKEEYQEMKNKLEEN